MADEIPDSELVLSATEFLSKLAAGLLVDSADKEVAAALADMMLKDLSVEEIVTKLNEIAALRSGSVDVDHG